MEGKTLLVKKTWTVEMNYFTDGSSDMMRTNDGFSSPELLGLMEFVKQEVLDQLRGGIKPTSVKRRVVKP